MKENNLWTNKQRQSNSLHYISYRACFKPELPKFFIQNFSKEQDIVFDPFSGRGTTVIEAALNNRQIISNDVDPISKIFTEPRINPPRLNEILIRLQNIKYYNNIQSDIDLSMFYQENTLNEILSLKRYLIDRRELGKEDYIDKWIRMIATNRLTGHSKNFFSVYTLPPIENASISSQIKINKKYSQKPEYKNTKEIIAIKSKQLLKDLNQNNYNILNKISKTAKYYNNDARWLKQIKNDSIDLIITSPPFLNLVNYVQNKWLYYWFNNIDINQLKNKITVLKRIQQWKNFVKEVIIQLVRVIKKDKIIVVEVGETKKFDLLEIIIQIVNELKLNIEDIMINKQQFTKVSNIWNIKNNKDGTNTNRMILFYK